MLSNMKTMQDIRSESHFNELEHDKLTQQDFKIYCSRCGNEIEYGETYYALPDGTFLCKDCIDSLERVNDGC